MQGLLIFRNLRHAVFALALMGFATNCATNTKGTAGPDAEKPQSQFVTTRVGPAGGTVKLLNGATIVIPPGALDRDVDISILQSADAPSLDVTILSSTYEFQPDGLQFALPATVTIPVTANASDGTVYWTLPATTDQYEDIGGIPSSDGSVMQVPVTHFSRGFVGTKKVVNPVNEGGFVQVRTNADVDHVHTCALRNDATVWCWGDNHAGELGVAMTTAPLRPVQVLNADGTPLSDVAEVAVGQSHTCALKRTSGEVWCWGSNELGQLGIGAASAGGPVPVFAVAPASAASTPLSGVTHIASAHRTTCAIKSGSVYCWGTNEYGALGTGDTTFKSKYSATAPLPPIGCPIFDSMNTQNYADACVGVQRADANGNRLCADYVHQDSPLLVFDTSIPTAGRYPATKIVASKTHMCLIDSYNYVWCSGGYDGGRTKLVMNQTVLDTGGDEVFSTTWMGNGYVCDHNSLRANNSIPEVPQAFAEYPGNGLPSANHFTQLSQGVAKTMAVGRGAACGTDLSDVLKCQGANVYGQVGVGTSGVADSANQVISVASIPLLSGAIQNVAGYGDHFCATGNDGALKCWGSNDLGQVGTPQTNPVTVTGPITGTYYPVTSPQAVSDVFGVAGATLDFTVGVEHTCAIKAADGSVWCWGGNAVGQLGNSLTSTQPSATPQQVTGFK